mgnify:CR=1 FL=1
MNDNGNWDMDDVINLDDNEITLPEWESKYKPIKNHLSKYDDTMFDTHDEQYAYVSSQDPKYVWTMVDGEMSTLLVPG